MEEQDKTFRRLRRTPYEEMEEHLKNIPTVPPMFHLGGSSFETRKSEIVRHYEQIRVLGKHGWEFEEYVLESEKRNIIKAIDLFNKDNIFPLELVQRAKEFFPDARFTQAKIDLE